VEQLESAREVNMYWEFNIIKAGTHCNLPKERDDSIAIENDHIAMPQLVLTLFHACICRIFLVKVYRLKHLERTPAMVHKHLRI
jgi:hypothetical protein